MGDGTATSGRARADRQKQVKPAATLERLLTVGDVADLLQVHPRTISRAIERHELEAIELSPRITRITASAFNEYLRRRRL